MIPRHSAISLGALQEKGYREDRAARRRFEAPYRYFTIPGLLLFFGSVPLAMFVLVPRFPNDDWTILGIVLAVAGFVMVSIPTWRILYVAPTNKETGSKLDIYERSDTKAEDGYLEWIYADHDAKTYFVRPARLGYSNIG